MANKVISLTDKQNTIKNNAIEWYNNYTKPVFTIAGVAGSGKTTLLSFITDELSISLEEIAFCAFTGMASCVLLRKGLPATTIHKLIYIPIEVTDEKTKKKKIAFKLREELDSSLKLIVVDEVSMVNDKMMEELIGFNIPIMVIGDPFQLQPVFGTMNQYLNKPDGFLDEPLRQALESPIIWLSNEIRHKRKPKAGTMGDEVRIYNKKSFPMEILQDANQIIAGKNATCDRMNKIFRKNFLNIDSLLPKEHEKLICVRNNWNLVCSENGIETFLVNGLLGESTNVKYNKVTKTFELSFRPVFMEDSSFNGITGDLLMFNNPMCKDDDYIEEHYYSTAVARIPMQASNTYINKFQYGYCISCYKSQGSQFPHVLYFDEMLNRSIYYEHFYTAVTRAEERLDIVL